MHEARAPFRSVLLETAFIVRLQDLPQGMFRASPNIRICPLLEVYRAEEIRVNQGTDVNDVLVRMPPGVFTMRPFFGKIICLLQRKF